ncbi:uncharacterized protein BKA78DRAFT_7261 [Phyllosticta capitalensis]|uniref:uncharacterized protein n=1 Tax=Phyllosticta capitalensis TaxID=121624 RepID=UPI003131DBC0
MQLHTRSFLLRDQETSKRLIRPARRTCFDANAMQARTLPQCRTRTYMQSRTLVRAKSDRYVSNAILHRLLDRGQINHLVVFLSPFVAEDTRN